MAVNDIIYGSDYNAVQVKIRQILGDGIPFGPTGSGDRSFGYNQPLQTVAVNQGVGLVNPGQLITALHWSALAQDINKAYYHQNNANFPSYPTITADNQITFSNLSLLDGIVSPMVSTLATRVNAHPSQRAKVQNGSLTNTRLTSWGAGNTSITGAFQISWDSANAMQYFFNQGGSIQVEGFGPSLSGSTQDANWYTFLSNLRYTLGYNQFAALTGSPTTLLNVTDTAINYTSNRITIQAYQSGNTLYVSSITYTDGHTPTGAGPDSVSAGAGYYVYITNATGVFEGTAPVSVATTTGF
jgi:hypothetical protein